MKQDAEPEVKEDAGWLQWLLALAGVGFLWWVGYNSGYRDGARDTKNTVFCVIDRLTDPPGVNVRTPECEAVDPSEDAVSVEPSQEEDTVIQPSVGPGNRPGHRA